MIISGDYRFTLRRARRFAPLLTLVVTPATGFAADVTIGVDTTYVHDTNFYRTQSDTESADYIQPAGIIRVDHEGSRARYDATYKGAYQKFNDDDQDESGGPEHRFRLRGSYDINQLTSFRVSNNFRDIRNLRFTQEDIRDGDTGQDPRDERYQRNDLELLLHRDLATNWEMDFSATQQFIDYNRNVDRSDSDSLGTGLQVLHRFAPRHRVGGGLYWVQQDFDGDYYRLDSQAEYQIADLAWVFDIAEQVQLRVHGGPARIDTNEDSAYFVQQTEFVGGTLNGELFRANVRSCGFDAASGTGIASQCNADTPGAAPIPADGLGNTQSYALEDGGSPIDDDDTTFFGGAALQGRFADWTVDTEILRRQSAPSGDAIAAELTQFRWDVGYAPPLAVWSTYFAGSVERREAFSNSTVIDYFVIPGPVEAAQRNQAFTSEGNDDRRDSVTALVGVRRQFTRNLSGDLAATYRTAERRVEGRESDWDAWFFSVTVSYQFDAFRL